MLYLIIISGAVALLYWLLASPAKPKTEHHEDPDIGGALLRGSRVLSSGHSAETIVKRDPGIGMTLAMIPIPRGIEVNGFLFSGAPGTGKSVAFTQLLDHCRTDGHRAVVVDANGDFLRRYFNPETDVILNAMDERSADWSPFAEMRQPYDALRLAKSIAPDGVGEASIWATYSQQFISAAILRLWERDGATAKVSELIRILVQADLTELRALFRGLPAEGLLTDGAEKMLASIRADVGAKMAPFAYLRDSDAPFSVTDFIKNEGKGWIFITYRDDQFSLLSQVISAQLDAAISATLSLPPDRNRRIVFALDEFATLPKISSILDLLTKSRKAGGVPVLGLQSVSQVASTYGKDDSETILSCLGSVLCLRAPNAESAEWASKRLGKAEIKRITQSASGSAEGGIGWSEQVAETFAVLPSQMQNLPTCEGYFSLVGPYHPARVKLDFPPAREDKAVAFMERDFKAEGIQAKAVEQAQVSDVLGDMLDTDTTESEANTNTNLFDAFDEIQTTHPE